MGGGSYSYSTASLRRSSTYATMSTNQIFTQHRLNEEMNIKSKIRECCENAEHPETYPIIVALDVTGSMGYIPSRLIKEDFPEMVKKIIEGGVECPQICFVAVGDHEWDSSPFQAGQFEASDELMEKWLTNTYLEGGGGGNAGESYGLAWYFAARHTACDAIKRGKKGLLITIGDEPVLKDYPQSAITGIFGDGAQAPITAAQMLEEAKEKWEVYHINVEDYSGQSPRTKNCWNELLGDHVIHVPAGENSSISDVIASLAVQNYKKTGTATVDTTLTSPTGEKPDVTGTSTGAAEVL